MENDPVRTVPATSVAKKIRTLVNLFRQRHTQKMMQSDSSSEAREEFSSVWEDKARYTHSVWRVEGQIHPRIPTPTSFHARYPSTDSDLPTLSRTNSLDLQTSPEPFPANSLGRLDECIDSLEEMCWVSKSSSVTQLIQAMVSSIKSSMDEWDANSAEEQSQMIREIIAEVHSIEAMLPNN